MDTLLSATGVWKRFGGVAALRGVDFSAQSGEIVGLLGANGAGKSTLVKIISGALTADAGDISIGGRRTKWSSPREAIAAGVRMLPQEISVFSDLSVAENIFIGNFPRRSFGGLPLADRRKAERCCREALDELGMDVSPNAPMRRLRASEQRLVEIARAVAGEARVLILDEPTASLTTDESERLFAILRRLRERGAGIVYISHYLDEVFRICQRVLVLRDGENAGEFATATASQDNVLTAMVGAKNVGTLYPPRARRPGENALKVCGLSAKGEVADAEFSVRAGEIFGVFGLLGSGIAAIGRAVFGAMGPSAHEFKMPGFSRPPRTPQEGLKAGVGFVAAERKREGILPDLSLRENITLPFLRKYTSGMAVSKRREREQTLDVMTELGIRAQGTEQAAKNLSGGNQQKMCIARWLSGDIRLLVLEEPTRGVDVGARGEIYAKLRQLTDNGMAVLLVSSDAEEVAGLADRSIALVRGRVAARFESPVETATLMRAAVVLAEKESA